MRILLTGGGTGGHIYPALTLAEEMQRLQPQAEFLYAGTAAGLEADLVPRAGLEFAAVRSGALVRMSPGAFLRGAARTVAGIGDAWSLLGRFRPQLVLATGGYVCGPVLAAALLRRLPFALWEGNACPGATVRLFARWARGTIIPYPEARRHFPAGARLLPLGRPIRRQVLSADRPAARRALGYGEADEVVLAFGGSQGARGIHRALVAAAPRLAQRPGWRLLHATGHKQYDEVAALYRSAGIEPEGHPQLRLVRYVYDMPMALAAADVAVIRAGASSIAEVAGRGLPAVVIPFPHSTHGHQEHNARALAQRGAATMLQEAGLNGETLVRALLDLLESPEARRRMGAAARASADPQAAEKIARQLLQWANYSQ